MIFIITTKLGDFSSKNEIKNCGTRAISHSHHHIQLSNKVNQFYLEIHLASNINAQATGHISSSEANSQHGLLKVKVSTIYFVENKKGKRN